MDPTGVDATRERSNSISSSSSAGNSPTSPKPRRNSAGLFASLEQTKRPSDPASIARRQSLHEQRPTPGLFGKMWNTWVRGVPPS
ncbi:hypothetical protein MCOR25_000458 [Pyricularia grisea]|uniref:Conidiation-specific protein-like protein n=1 Tax=Pyricularia grisea TaxID=148305 RepID=A0A6P8AVI7_PYRGI|nr:uncharacterized protein PgNI_08830 [Pyricularia grisea]KAI6382949.1 hypothetical protein MCOR25_000458 [Pyricularia grisea]TLD06210.1 hypothetical protein PgNI_08830 [Pyricularia grisea]